jgi:redox-sensitive bicupin YhaK (pirin superfamily)
MSNIDLIVEERPTDIGDFLVGRLLPFRKKRSVGPFVFIDHMGPAELTADENLDVGPHPHIGLSTLTFLFEGNIVHRDSLGSEVEIKPGAVNWMTAGKGIVHSERTPNRLRNQQKKVHGLQIWVALPKELEDCEPTFSHTTAQDIPSWSDGSVDYKLIAGEALGKKSPVPVHSELYFIEIKANEDTTIELGDQLYGESALYILEGAIEKGDDTFGPKQILVAKRDTMCSFTIKKGSTVYVFGGMPFPEERFIHWNFVSTRKEKIEKAREDWKAQRFDKIPGDEDGYVPLPD